uniref:Prominin 1 n=1 Tax=Sus scrofa TaxID=9823 RepID=A0A8D1Y313_PIG
MAPVLGFLLLLGLCGDTVSEGPLTSTDRSVGLKFEFPPVKYETEESYEAGPINILFQIVHVFLHLVQPNPFPEGKLIESHGSRKPSSTGCQEGDEKK